MEGLNSPPKDTLTENYIFRCCHSNKKNTKIPTTDKIHLHKTLFWPSALTENLDWLLVMQACDGVK